MGIEPIGRVMLAVFRKLAWFVENHGVARARPSVCFSNNRSGSDCESNVLQTRAVS